MSMTKPEFVVDVEMSFTVEELESLKNLSNKKGWGVEETARWCITEKCKEELLVISS